MAWRKTPPGHPDRLTARDITHWYRQAMASPDGIYEHNLDGACIAVHANPELLLRLMENFAEYGTFFPPEIVERELATAQLKLVFEELLRQGWTQQDAVGYLSDEFEICGKGYSESSIERKIGKRKTSKT